MDKYKKIAELDQLRKNGSITEEEYQNEKSKILTTPDYTSVPKTNAFGMDDSGYTALMHISQFSGYILFGLGFAVPIIMWAMSKENPTIDKHGKNIFNFMISSFIYLCIAGLLCFVLIGIPLVIALLLFQIISIIIATVKAANGEYWKYPLTIPFMG